MASKYVYFFGSGKADGKAEMKGLLGGKGANLAEMTNIGLPVPAGFTISTEVCTYYYDNKRKYPKELEKQVKAALQKVEKSVGSEIWRSEKPTPGFRPLRRACLDAGNDGYHPQSWIERRYHQGPDS